MASTKPELREYARSDVVSFRKTSEEFGGLSNMAPGYPIHIGGRRVPTSEALYQACRFPHMPDVQELIISQSSPMTAKMRSKPYRSQSRSDWDQVRVPIMKWCLRMKLVQNWEKFGNLLLQTGDRPIVEDSRKDDFWGAKVDDEGVLRGRNVLGRLLMELREKLRTAPETLETIEAIPIADFLMLTHEIPTIVRAAPRKTLEFNEVVAEPLLFTLPGLVGEDAARVKPQPDHVDMPTEAVQLKVSGVEIRTREVPTNARIPYRRIGWFSAVAILAVVGLWLALA